MLREGSPVVPDPASSNWRPDKKVSGTALYIIRVQTLYALSVVGVRIKVTGFVCPNFPENFLFLSFSFYDTDKNGKYGFCEKACISARLYIGL